MSEVTRRYELIKWLTLYFDIMPSKSVEIIEQLKKSLSPQPQIDVEGLKHHSTEWMSEWAQARVQGWNACIDELVKRNILHTQAPIE